MEIKFKDLSGWLKTFVVCGWIVFGIEALAFLIGVIIGLTTY